MLCLITSCARGLPLPEMPLRCCPPWVLIRLSSIAHTALSHSLSRREAGLRPDIRIQKFEQLLPYAHICFFLVDRDGEVWFNK